MKPVLTATVAAAALAGGSAPWRIVDVGTPTGATSSESTGVGTDAAGDIVANSSDAAELTGRAFVFHGWTSDAPADARRPRQVHRDVRRGGQPRGRDRRRRDDRSGDTHATLWRNGKAFDLGVLPGGDLSEAHAVAPNGDAAGRSTTGHGQHVVLWRKGRQVDLGPPPPLPHADDPNAIVNALNDADEIVGVSETEFFGHITAQRAFRSVGRRLVPLTPPRHAERSGRSERVRRDRRLVQAPRRYDACLSLARAGS